MGFFGESCCFLILYCATLVNVPIGIIGGIVQLVRSIFITDNEKRAHTIDIAKVFFISAFPFVGPLFAAARLFEKKK